MPYGTANVDVIQSSTSGTPVQFKDGNGTQIGTLCRAWVIYNGSTQTVTASFNVSSVTYVGTGNYTVNFTNAMADNKYSAVATADSFAVSNNVAPLAGSCNVQVYQKSATTTLINSSYTSLAIFR